MKVLIDSPGCCSLELKVHLCEMNDGAGCWCSFTRERPDHRSFCPSVWMERAGLLS